MLSWAGRGAGNEPRGVMWDGVERGRCSRRSHRPEPIAHAVVRYSTVRRRLAQREVVRREVAQCGLGVRNWGTVLVGAVRCAVPRCAERGDVKQTTGECGAGCESVLCVRRGEDWGEAAPWGGVVWTFFHKNANKSRTHCTGRPRARRRRIADVNGVAGLRCLGWSGTASAKRSGKKTWVRRRAARSAQRCTCGGGYGLH